MSLFLENLLYSSEVKIHKARIMLEPQLMEKLISLS